MPPARISAVASTSSTCAAARCSSSSGRRRPDRTGTPMGPSRRRETASSSGCRATRAVPCSCTTRGEGACCAPSPIRATRRRRSGRRSPAADASWWSWPPSSPSPLDLFTQHPLARRSLASMCGRAGFAAVFCSTRRSELLLPHSCAMGSRTLPIPTLCPPLGRQGCSRWRTATGCRLRHEPSPSVHMSGCLRPASWGTLLVLFVLAAPALAEDAAVRCQHAIEEGGSRYVAQTFHAIERCTHRRLSSLDACVDVALRGERLVVLRRKWGRSAAHACSGVAVGHTLGYLDTCLPPSAPSRCSFQSARLHAKGRNNALLDCLACQIGERLRNAAHALFAGRPVRSACQGTIGEQGIAVLRKMTDEIQACVEEPGSVSIAACLADPSRQ